MFLAEISRELLIQAFLVFVFIVLPIVRALREAASKRREMAERQRGLGEPAAGEDPRDEARRRWEALLRGEVPEPPAAPAAPPPVPVAGPAARVPVEAAPDAQLAGPLSAFPSTPTEDEVEEASDETTADPEHSIPDEEARAREENERRLREERAERTELLRRERAEGAGKRATVAPLAMTTLGDVAPASVPGPAARTPARVESIVGGPGAAARRAALRRAVIAAEVLGSPAALRDPEAGPLGLRRTA